ncbi:hypothetical protein pb186bvf_019316 [Paramecium bursaria]
MLIIVLQCLIQIVYLQFEQLINIIFFHPITYTSLGKKNQRHQIFSTIAKKSQSFNQQIKKLKRPIQNEIQERKIKKKNWFLLEE